MLVQWGKPIESDWIARNSAVGSVPNIASRTAAGRQSSVSDNPMGQLEAIVDQLASQEAKMDQILLMVSKLSTKVILYY